MRHDTCLRRSLSARIEIRPCIAIFLQDVSHSAKFPHPTISLIGRRLFHFKGLHPRWFLHKEDQDFNLPSLFNLAIQFPPLSIYCLKKYSLFQFIQSNNPRTSFKLQAMSNKSRVFVALYFLQGGTKLPEDRAPGERPKFHWAIAIQDKHEKNLFTAIDVKMEHAYANLPDSGGWTYHYKPNADTTRSYALLGMIMIGKRPTNVDVSQVDEALRAIPVPREDADPAESCRTWVLEAIPRLQQLGCAEPFDINDFEDYALRQGDEWFKGNPTLDGKKERVNYTDRPM